MSSSLSELFYVGFLSSSFRVLSVLRFCPYTYVFPLSPLLVSPFSLLAGLLTWLFSFRCHLPPPLPPAITGSCSLSLPHFLRYYSFSVLSAPSVFVSFLLVYMTYCLASCSSFRLGSWVLCCPGSPLSIYASAFFLGFMSSSFTASALLLDSP